LRFEKRGRGEMRRRKSLVLFALVLIISAQFLPILINAAFPPIGATVQTNPYESNPNPSTSAHIARGDPYTSSPTARAVYSITVTSPWLAHDRDPSTNAYFLYNKGTAASPGYLELKTFTQDTQGAAIADNGVTMKMKFSAQAATDDLYRITYYVETDGPYVLVEWTSAETVLGTYTWTPPRTWTWTDVSNIRFRIETQLVSTSDGKRIDVYEMWLTVALATPQSSEPYISLGGPSSPDVPHGYHDGDLFAIAPTSFYYMFNGYFEIKSFTNTPTTSFPIRWVDFKISYAAKASVDDKYRIVYYVGTAGPVVLQDWVSGLDAQFVWPGVDPTIVSGAGEQSQRTWSNMPEPTNGVWDWTDIGNVRIRIETSLVGNEDFAKISLYEVWLTVYASSFPDPGPGLSIQPTVVLLGVGQSFFIDIYVTDVVKMYGFQFTVYYNTTMLTALDFFSYNPFAFKAPSAIEDDPWGNGTGRVAVAFSSYMGDGVGFTGATPVARIYFSIDAEGTSSLHFYRHPTTFGWSDVFGQSIEPVYVRDGVSTTSPTHDVAVQDVKPNVAQVTPGGNVNIDVTVKNEGTSPENVTVTVFYNTSITDWKIIDVPKTVKELAAVDTKTVTFTWNTAGVERDRYLIKAEATLPPDVIDDDPSDNVKEDGMIVVGRHDVAVTSVVRAYPTEDAVVPEPEPAVRDVDNSGTYIVDVVLVGATPPFGAGLTAPGPLDKYWDKNDNSLWDKDEPAVRDVDGSGTYTAVDVVLVGATPPFGAGLTAPGPLDKFRDVNTNGVWDVGESAVRDVDSNGTYTFDVVLAGYTPPLGEVLTTAGTLDKYYDVDDDDVWDEREPAIRDVDSSGNYTAADVVLAGATGDVRFAGITPPLGGVLKVPGAKDKYYDKNGNGVWDGELNVEKGEIVYIKVTVKNEGDFTETFNVTAYYEGDGQEMVQDPKYGKKYDVGNETRTLAPGASETLTFAWNTTTVKFKIGPTQHWSGCRVKARVTEVKYESGQGYDNTANNILVNSDVNVTRPVEAYFEIFPKGEDQRLQGKRIDFDATNSFPGTEPGAEFVKLEWDFGDGTQEIYVKPGNLTTPFNAVLKTPGTLDKYYDKPNSKWDKGEPAIRDVNGNGLYDDGVDEVLAGDPPPNGAVLKTPRPLDKYYDINDNGLWDVGESAVRDNDNNGAYSAGDEVLAGVTPPDGGVLKTAGTLDKYYDKTNEVWDAKKTLPPIYEEPAIRDVNGNGVYDAGDELLAAETTPPINSILISPGPLDKYWDKNGNGMWDKILKAGEFNEPAIRDVNDNGVYDAGDVLLAGVAPSLETYKYSVSHTYAKVGKVKVTLKVTTNVGKSNTQTQNMTVYGYNIAVTNVIRAYPTRDVPIPSDTVLTVKEGEKVYINVTVANKDVVMLPWREDLNVTVYFNDVKIETKTVRGLLNGTSTTVTSTWNTAGITAGTYTIKANATALFATTRDAEDKSDNQFIDGAVKVLALPVVNFTYSPSKPIAGQSVTFNASESYDPDGTIASYSWDFGDGTPSQTVVTKTATHIFRPSPPVRTNFTVTLTVTDNDGVSGSLSQNVTVYVHDVNVTEVTVSATEVVAGESVTINVAVANEGDFGETFALTVKYGDHEIQTQTVTLDLGSSTTLPFIWDTGGVAADTYTISAVATLDVDNDLSDNTGVCGETVTVNPSSSIFLYVVAGVAVAIAIAGVAVYLFKFRKPKPPMQP